jgi:regulatory protein YycI of two-component signal transduction system YycFG
MDWNNTKTVFIITFLILNIFLGYKLIERKNESQLDVITQSTMADLLSEMEITYPKLPEIKATETHITAVNIPYEEKEVKKLASKQQIQVQEDGKLIAVLNEPFPLSNTVQPVEEIKQYISENVINGKDYMFWRSDIENNIYYFFQTFEGKPIYFNQKGMVIVHLNDKS